MPDASDAASAAIEVAVKNQDNREHDIFDSDDYLQDHGGMIATVRALTGRGAEAWFGDQPDPARPRVRIRCAEEARRVVRTRVLNPKWIGAMMRHGYKGAFEMAATVDYLFGYDATAGCVEDWMYEQVTGAYVADPAVQEVLRESNPWALRGIAERLLEAADRKLWERPDPELLARLRRLRFDLDAYLEDWGASRPASGGRHPRRSMENPPVRTVVSRVLALTGASVAALGGGLRRPGVDVPHGHRGGLSRGPGSSSPS